MQSQSHALALLTQATAHYISHITIERVFDLVLDIVTDEPVNHGRFLNSMALEGIVKDLLVRARLPTRVTPDVAHS